MFIAGGDQTGGDTTGGGTGRVGASSTRGLSTGGAVSVSIAETSAGTSPRNAEDETRESSVLLPSAGVEAMVGSSKDAMNDSSSSSKICDGGAICKTGPRLVENSLRRVITEGGIGRTVNESRDMTWKVSRDKRCTDPLAFPTGYKAMHG